MLQAALMGLWEQNRPPGALSTRAPGHRAQGGCFTCKKYIKRVFNKNNVKGFIIALSCVVICVCQDNKEWHEGSLLVHLSWQGLVSLLLFRQLPRTISPVFTYLNWIRYDGYPNQNKNGLGIQEATMFCFWNKVYVDFFFFNVEIILEIWICQSKHIKADGWKKTHMLYIGYDFLSLLCLPSERWKTTRAETESIIKC